MKSKLVRSLALFLVILMVLSLGACSSPDSTPQNTASGEPTKGEPAKGEPVKDDLIVGTYGGSLVGSVSPQSVAGAADNQSLAILIYDQIFYIDPDTSEATSDIISSYKWSDDSLGLTLVLKPNITFSNGDVMTGEDILYSIKRTQQSILGGYYTAINVDKSTVDSDGLTVHLVYDEVYGPGLCKLDVFVCNKKFVESLGENPDWYDIANAVGSGPYKVVDFVPNASVTAELRDDYWNDKKPAVKRFEFHLYTDQTTMGIDFENGIIDMAMNCADSDTQRFLNPTADNIAVEVIGSNSVVNLGLSPFSEAFQDINVRKAVCLAVNTTTMTQTAYGSLGMPATGEIAKGVKGYVDGLAYSQDIEQAKKILADAGYKDGDIQLNFPTRTNGAYPAISDILQSQLDAIGIKLNVTLADFPTLRETAYMTPGGTDFQCITSADGNPECEAWFALSPFEAPAPFPALSHKDEDFNSYLQQGLRNIDDEIRNEGWAKAQQWLYDNYWVIPICEWASSAAYNPKIIKDVHLTSTFKANLKFIELA